MKKKMKNDPWARVKIGEPPFSFDPFNKELMDKLEYANKYGCAEIEIEDKDVQLKSKATSSKNNRRFPKSPTKRRG